MISSENDNIALVADLTDRVQRNMDIGHCVPHSDREVLVGDTADEAIAVVLDELAACCPEELSSQ